MRIPWGSLGYIEKTFLKDHDFASLGCLSFEERCLTTPLALANLRCKWIEFLEVVDPIDAFPDYSSEARRKRLENKNQLVSAKLNFHSTSYDLMLTEDELLDAIAAFEKQTAGLTVVLDITSFPKRYFCFILKRLMMSPSSPNLVVTYTEAARYTSDHLTEDPMTPDHLPGFAPPLFSSSTLVIAVGFESLGTRSIVEAHGENPRDVKIIMSYPPDSTGVRRQWRTLMELTMGNADDVNLHNLSVIAAWDSEEVYSVLQRWSQEIGGLTLAPFGAKPHTLGMALFAIQNDCGLIYSQPKSYNPAYSTGHGETWAYVVKWQGVPCYQRPVSVS